VTKTAGLFLVIVLAVGAARDIVCQLACANPDAAHAAAVCHESGDIGATLLQAVQGHCAGLDAAPVLTFIKVNALQHQGTAMFTRLRSTPQPLALPPALLAQLPPGAACPFPGDRTSVLRI
jgi:hypothetical protein